MAINADFPSITFQGANPFLVGRAASDDSLEKAIANQLAGVKARYAQPMAQNDLLAKELQNQLEGIKAKYAEPNAQQELKKLQQYNQYYAPNIQSEIGLRGAQAGHYGELSKNLQFDRQNPLLSAPDTKTLGALLADPRFRPVVENYLKSQGQQGMQMPQQQGTERDPNQLPSPLGAAQEQQNPGQQNNQTTAEKLVSQYLDHQGQKQGGIREWDRQPAPIKNAELAQARAFGFNDTEGVKLLREGHDLADLAQMKGYSLDGTDWPQSIFNPAAQTIARQQRSNIAQAGIEELEPRIAKKLEPYAKKWNGVSLVQLHQSLGGKNDKEIGEAIGAAAVSHELSALRLTSGGITPGIGALKKSLEASHTDLKTPGLTLTPKQFEHAQQFISDAVRDLNKAENKAAFGQRGQAKSQSQKKDPSMMTSEEIERELGGLR